MSSRKTLKSVDIKVPDGVKVTVNNKNIKVKQLENDIEALERTNKWFKKQIEPHDCGWMYTTIDGIKHRIKVLKDELKGKKPKHWAEYL